MKRQTFEKYFFQNKSLIFVTILLVLFSATCAELTPYLQGVIAGKLTGSTDNSIIFLCVAFSLAMLLDALSRCYLDIMTNKIGFKTAKQIRTDFFGKIVRQPYTFFTNKQNGDLIHRSNTFIYDIGSFLSSNVNNLSIGVARFLIIFTFMFILDTKLAFLILLLFFSILIVAILQSKRTYEIGKKFRNLELHRNSLILQNVENLETYLAYNDDFQYLKNYEKVNKEYGICKQKYYRSKHLINPIIDFLVSLVTVLIYSFAFSTSGIVEIAVIVAMLTYATRLTTPIQLIASGIADYIHIHTTTDKIIKYIAPTKETPKNRFSAENVDIVCSHVYGHVKTNGIIFENINLRIPFKSKIAILGEYGIGKTDFAEMLLGLNEPDVGQIFFNEKEVNTIVPEDLHKIITLVSDCDGIIDGTIAENLRLAKKNATNTELKAVLKKVGLEPVLKSFPKGLETKITKNTMSDGNKQLLAFARIILKDTPVVVFDEFTRNLDIDTKELFYTKLQKFAKDRTIIYISQDLPKNIVFDKKIYFKKYINNRKISNLLDI